MTKPKIEKPWREWDAEKIGGISIIEPTGFEMGDPYEKMYVYSKDEFLVRRAQCKVSGYVSPLRKVVE